MKIQIFFFFLSKEVYCFLRWFYTSGNKQEFCNIQWSYVTTRDEKYICKNDLIVLQLKCSIKLEETEGGVLLN